MGLRGQELGATSAGGDAAAGGGPTHWLSLASAGADGALATWPAAEKGRAVAGEELAAWAAGHGVNGLAVVTGSPGTGKSALITCLVLAAGQARRDWPADGDVPGPLINRMAEVLPAEPVPLTPVDAHGLSADQVAALVAAAWGRPAGGAGRLLADLARTPERDERVLAVDAVDESTSPTSLLSGLLVPLSRQPGVRVVAAARRQTLLGAGGLGLVIDLDAAEYADPEALISYARRLLLSPGARGGAGRRRAGRPAEGTANAHAVASVIAARASGGAGSPQSFLLARLLAQIWRSGTLAYAGTHRPGTQHPGTQQPGLPGNPGEAFEASLAQWGHQARPARALLCALAWARGPGLPWEDLWVPVARALAQFDGTATDVSDNDVRWLLDHAASHVVSDTGPGGRPVYRLCHDLLAAHLRGEPDSPRRQAAERCVVDALLATVPRRGGRAGGGRDWLAAHPYVLTYLAQHAEAAGTGALPGLVADLGYLAAADPVTLGPLLSFAPKELSGVARAYRRARPLLGPDHRANAAYLQEASVAVNVAEPSPAGPAVPVLYRTRLASARRDDKILTLSGHTSGIAVVAFGRSPDGRLLLVSGSDDQTLRIWDPVTGAPVSEPLAGHTGWVDGAAFGTTADGRLLLASSGSDHTVRIWDPLTGEPIGEPLTGHTGWAIAVSFGLTPDGQLLLASGAADNTVRIWDPLTGALVRGPLTGHTGWVTSVAFGTCPDGRLLLASGSFDHTVRVWDPLTGEPAGEPLTGHTDRLHEVALAPVPPGRASWLPGGGLVLASCGEDRTARLWDPLTGMPLGEPMHHPDELDALAMTATPGGDLLLAAGCEDHMVWVWDALTCRPLGQLAGHISRVAEVDFGVTASGRLLLASGSEDHAVLVWDPPMPGTVSPARADTENTRWVDSVAFGAWPAPPPPSTPLGPGGGLVLACGAGGTDIRLWDPLAGVPVGELLTGHEDTVHSLAFATVSGHGERVLLASASGDKTVRVWDPVSGTQLGEPLTGHTDEVRCVAFWAGPDGTVLLASASDDTTVRVWDPLTGRPVGEPFTGHQSWVNAVVFCPGPDGRPLLASAGGDKAVRVWDPHTGTPAVPPLLGHIAGVRTLALTVTADGPLLASGGDMGFVRLWHPLTGQPAAEPLTRHEQWVSSVAFMTLGDGEPGGARNPLLVSAGGDKTVRVWDTGTGCCVMTMRRRTPVRSIAAAGVMLAIGDDEGVCVVELDRAALADGVAGRHRRGQGRRRRRAR